MVDSRGFVLENITDLTTKERKSMKQKYCKVKYCICVEQFINCQVTVSFSIGRHQTHFL